MNHAAYWEFLPAPAAAAQTRALVRETLGCWNPTVALDDNVLMASELVSNAYLYGGHGPITVRLRVVREAGLLVCTVGDDSSRPPRPGVLHVSGAGGRGLALVAALSAAWGWYQRRMGKDVWFAQFIEPRAETRPSQPPAP